MRPPLVMGVLNVTPDSFSDGGQFLDHGQAVARGHEMAIQGADWIDVGGESTRPGAEPVSVDEECRRVLPVVEALSRMGLQVSIDTRKPGVAKLALAAGAKLVNDVFGLRDPEMRAVCAAARAQVCIMHMRGEPQTMQKNLHYSDVVAEVRDYLAAQCQLAVSAGIERERIWIDPGIGFGKTTAQNLELLRGLSKIGELGFPILIGVSRKAFLGRILGSEASPLPVGDREEATLSAQLFAVVQGASMIRCHDVQGTARSLRIWQALSQPSPGDGA